MPIQAIIDALRKADPLRKIGIANQNIDIIARDVAASGKSAHAYFKSHDINMQLPMSEIIDNAVLALPPVQVEALRASASKHIGAH